MMVFLLCVIQLLAPGRLNGLLVSVLRAGLTPLLRAGLILLLPLVLGRLYSCRLVSFRFPCRRTFSWLGVDGPRLSVCPGVYPGWRFCCVSCTSRMDGVGLELVLAAPAVRAGIQKAAESTRAPMARNK